jgi:hypothetical protein
MFICYTERVPCFADNVTSLRARTWNEQADLTPMATEITASRNININADGVDRMQRYVQAKVNVTIQLRYSVN